MRRSPRNTRTKLPWSKGDGDDDEELTSHPYAPLFSIKLRFSRVIGKVDQVKFVVQDALRSRSKVSERPQFDWCLSMKSTERALHKNHLPSHSITAFGYIGCLSSMLSQSSFVAPRSVKRRAHYPQVPSNIVTLTIRCRLIGTNRPSMNWRGK